jgi:hypothetical protein
VITEVALSEATAGKRTIDQALYALAMRVA